MRPTITESITPYDFATGIDLGDGFAERRAAHQGRHNARVLEAARLICDVAGGRCDPMLLREAFNPTQEFAVIEIARRYPGLINLREAPVGGMSVSDFSMLNLDVLDRLMYGMFTATPSVSAPMQRNHPLKDFRNVSRYMIDGATKPPEAVAPGAQPKEVVIAQQPVIQYAPQKYESFTRVVWEAMINDDLGAFTDLANRLVVGATRGIEMFRTGLYVDVNGPNALLYKTAFTNQILIANGASVDNPKLTTQGLADALTVLARMVDSDGFPIVLTGKMYLWYGPALLATAQNLLHMLTVQLQTAGGQGNALGFPTQFVQTNNWVVQNLVPIMNPFLRIVCTTAGVRDTMWGITLDPGSADRPAMEFGFLRGFETPQIYAKAPNTMRAGGGLDASLGDFYTMSQELKSLTVYGGKQIDGHTTVSSTGQGVS
jgi:hypothetical protein